MIISYFMHSFSCFFVGLEVGSLEGATVLEGLEEGSDDGVRDGDTVGWIVIVGALVGVIVKFELYWNWLILFTIIEDVSIESYTIRILLLFVSNTYTYYYLYMHNIYNII